MPNGTLKQVTDLLMWNLVARVGEALFLQMTLDNDQGVRSIVKHDWLMLSRGKINLTSPPESTFI